MFFKLYYQFNSLPKKMIIFHGKKYMKNKEYCSTLKNINFVHFGGNMRLLYILFLFSAFGILLTSCEETTNSQKSRIKTLAIEFAPNVYKDNGKIVGIDTEIAQKLFEKTGLNIPLPEVN